MSVFKEEDVDSDDIADGYIIGHPEEIEPYLDGGFRMLVWRLTHPQQNREIQQRARKVYALTDWAKVEHLQRCYDITLDEFYRMFEAQAGLCACCGASFPDNKDPCVDHNHETGQVRGLLCTRCNLYLGQYERGRLDETHAYITMFMSYLQAYDRRCVVKP